jgi:hypothetical protein
MTSGSSTSDTIFKNKPRPALDEVSRGTGGWAAFIGPMAPADRFAKLSKGEWLIVVGLKLPYFPPAGLVSPPPESGGLAAGVAPEAAEELVSGNTPEFVAHRIEVFDWIAEKGAQSKPPGDQAA